ncbi:glycosyltransferase family 2 protein [Orrella sp. JC864]|uniref:glycosyltransferase family 2 protein n=1 Tax=Orrella sp. JC864 TaxID=3120298 RepID=UPI003008C6D8
MKLGLAGIVKNEADTLLEWIAYHRVIGIDSFFIADNDSTDGTREILAALSSHGMAETIDVPTLPGRKPQMPAYSALLGLARGKCDVLAFIDADEFLLPTDGADTLRPLVEKIFSDPQVSALALNWANFGSAGAVFIEDGLVIDRFTKRARREFGVHYHYKTLVRPECGQSFANPHHVRLNAGRYVTALGTEVVPHAKHGDGLSDKVVWEGARINHYATKSLEEFLVGKSRRGSASKEGRIKHKRYFLSHDRNDEECLLAQRFSESTKAELDRLSALIAPQMESYVQARRHNTPGLLGWIERKLARTGTA